MGKDPLTIFTDREYGSGWDPTFAVAETDPDLRLESELSDENSIPGHRYSAHRGPTFEPPLTADELAERRAMEIGRSCGEGDPVGVLDIEPMASYSEIGGGSEASKVRVLLADAF